MAKEPKSHESSGRASEGKIRAALARLLACENQVTRPMFAVEAKYGFMDRRADFLLLNEFTHAFEIKSDFDNTSRLEEQLAEYSSTFDFVTVVTTEKHVKKIRSLSSRKIGLITLRGGDLVRVREAKQNKRLSKVHLAASISKESLIVELASMNKHASLSEVRAKAVELLSVAELRIAFRREIEKRFSKTSDQFFNEVDREINEEDLLILRRVSRLVPQLI